MPGRRAGWARAGSWTTLKLVIALCATVVAAPASAHASTSVSLTFDDGQASQYATKAPLASHGMRGTFYLNSAKVGTSGFYMTWSQVAAIAADGNEIGGHTLTHADLSALSESQRRTEICDDRQNLVARGFNPVSFAHPYGGADATTQAIVSECGYKSGRRVGGIVSPNWCPACGSPRAELVPPENAFHVRTPSFGSGEITLAAIQGVVTQAELSGGGWVPLVFHGVCDSACDEGWIRTSTFSALLDWLAPRTAHGTFVRTMREVIEHVPPDTSLPSKPPAETTDRSASFTLASNPGGATFDCRLDGAAWAPCSSPVSYSSLSAGTHTFQARARDTFGAVDATPASWTWTIDVPPDPTTVSLTFDDAQATQYAVRDDLADHGMNGTFFVDSNAVCTSNCSGEFNMTWAQLDDLAADGNEIGGHTLDHEDLTSSALSTAEKRRQVCEDRENLIARGFDPVSFAYPYGHHDATARALVSECGYASARAAGDAPDGGETIPPLDPFATRTPGHSSDEITLAELQGAVTDAEAVGGGWVQLAFHGICATRCNEGWVKPSTFAAFLDWLEPRADTTGTVVRTVREVIEGSAPKTTMGSKPPAVTAATSASFTLSSDTAGATFQCSLDDAGFTPCTSPVSYSGLSNGSHTFRVRARDSLGAVDASPATWTWIVDTVAPDTSIASGPSGTVGSSAASFGFTATEAGSFECKLDSGAWGGCTSPKSYSGLGEGAHTFSVRALDALGNVDGTPATRTWTVDTVAPDTTITGGPSGTVGSSSASFGFTATEAGSFECRFDSGAWGACSSPKAYSGLGDGAHTFSVRGIDAVGNVDATPASRSWTVDTGSPDTSITGGASGTVGSSAASFGFSSSEAGTFECNLDAGAWVACGSPKAYSGLGDGEHTFSVRAIDTVGNIDATPARRTWTVDTTAPNTSISSGPSGTVGSSSASFGFSTTEAGTFECRLDSGAWGACTSPKSYSGLGDGEHTFSVRGIDAVGNVEASPAGRTWTVDTVAPDTSIASGPSGAVASPGASFAFAAAGATTFECKLNGGAWDACTSPKSYAGLGDGAHTFSVRAIDAVGNVDASPATRTWTVDTVAPNTSIATGPSGAVSSAAASFGFSATEAGSFECKLDSGEWGVCASPRSYAGLGEGEHTFSVRGIDAVGNVDGSPASRTWSVDTVAPDTSIVSGPSGTVATSAASFGLAATEAGSFECKLDTGDWGTCDSPKAFTGLSDGDHTFSVRARDAVGNADTTPATRTWTVDTVAPDTSIASGPTGAVAVPDAAFEFSAAGATSFECKLDSGAWGACTSPESYSGLGDGEHTFSVRGIDAVGNVDASPATRTWTVDTAAPTTSIASGPSGVLASAAAAFEFSATEAGAYECKLDSGTWDTCTSPHPYHGLADGEHTFWVRAADAVGNVDATPPSRTWTVDTVAPNTSLTSGPSGTVATTTASFRFSSTEPGTFQCKLDGGGWGGCTSPRAYSSLAEGEHTFSVRAIDGAGNTDSTPTTRTWAVDMPAAPATPAAEEEEEVDEEQVDDEEDDGDAWATAYLSGVLKGAARANKRKRIKALVRRRALRLRLPAADEGALRIKLSLLPDPPGPAIRLARGRAKVSPGAQKLKLGLGRKTRRKLRRLWVAAFELSATFRLPDGDVVRDRRVFLVRR